MPGVECAYDGKHKLGESPVWSVRDGALFWVDIYGPTINRLDPSIGQVKTWTLPDPVGAIGLRAKAGLVCATKRGFHRFDLKTGGLDPIADPESHLPDNRFNDGRCDRRGRFFAGTMSEAAREPTGSLYCLEPDLTVRVARSGIVIPNSLAWSPDDKAMYFADTERRKVWKYDYDADAGAISNERVFIDTSDRAGHPDGSTIDTDGCLWNAEYGGGRICRYTPDGRLDRVIELPVTQPTSLAFGGPKLDTLYVTSARQNLSPQALEHQPLAGALFVLTPGVTGLPEPAFGG